MSSSFVSGFYVSLTIDKGSQVSSFYTGARTGTFGRGGLLLFAPGFGGPLFPTGFGGGLVTGLTDSYLDYTGFYIYYALFCFTSLRSSDSYLMFVSEAYSYTFLRT